MVTEYTNLNEKVNYNINSDSVSPRLSGIKIDVPMEKVPLKVSQSINDKYSKVVTTTKKVVLILTITFFQKNVIT